MNETTQFINVYEQPLVEPTPREGEALDVGFGASFNDSFMEKLKIARQIMILSEERYPYEKTGMKKSGRLTNINDEIKNTHSVPLKSLKETIKDNYYDDELSQNKSVKNIQKSTSNSAQVAPSNDSQLNDEFENYIYYAKDGVDENDEYDVKEIPSLTTELLRAKQKQQGFNQHFLDINAPITEEMIKKSKLPDVIKQSFLKNPLTPPKITASLSDKQLDAISEQFHKQKLLKEQPNVQTKKQQTEQVQSIPKSKREKIKEQLRPIVKELIKEILLEKL